MQLAKRLVMTLVCLCVVTTLYIALLPNQTNAQSASSLCTSILPLIQKNLSTTCSALDRDQVCYGNRDILVQYSDAVSQISTARTFSDPGDVVSLNSIHSLTTMPFNAASGTWGLAVIRVQANLPGTVSGQAVTFIVYGDTSIIDVSATLPPTVLNNPSAPATLSGLNAFYFSTGMSDQATCNDLPASGLMIQSPKGYQVTFNANGTDITIGSTVVLRAAAKDKMTITVMEGHATVKAAGAETTAITGQEVAVPLGGQTGLAPIGPPMIEQPSAPVEQSIPSLCAIGRSMKLPMPCNTDAAPTKQNTVTPVIPTPPPPPHVDPPANTTAPQPSPTSPSVEHHGDGNHHGDGGDNQGNQDNQGDQQEHHNDHHN